VRESKRERGRNRESVREKQNLGRERKSMCARIFGIVGLRERERERERENEREGVERNRERGRERERKR